MIPSGLAHKNMTVMVRVGIPATLMAYIREIHVRVRYQEPVDINNGLYDFKGEMKRNFHFYLSCDSFNTDGATVNDLLSVKSQMYVPNYRDGNDPYNKTQF